MKTSKKRLAERVNGKHAVIYLRVSGDEQAEEGHGLEDQLDKCLAYCAGNGYEVLTTCSDEGFSGKLPMSERRGLTQAFDLRLTAEADVLVASAQDRYARSTRVWLDIRDTARELHLRLEGVKENCDLAASSNAFMSDIYAAVAEEERRNIAARTLGGRRVRSKTDGLGSGPTPYGYRRVFGGTPEKPVVTIALDEQAIGTVQAVLAELDGGASYRDVARTMAARGIEKPGGGTDWNVNTVQKIALHKELYTLGIRRWGDVVATEKWPVIADRQTL